MPVDIKDGRPTLSQLNIGTSFLLNGEGHDKQVLTVMGVTPREVAYEIGPDLKVGSASLADFLKRGHVQGYNIVSQFLPPPEYTTPEPPSAKERRTQKLPLFGIDLPRETIRDIRRLYGEFAVPILKSTRNAITDIPDFNAEEVDKRYFKEAVKVYGFDPSYVSPPFFFEIQNRGGVDAALEASSGTFTKGRKLDIFGDVKWFSPSPSHWLKELQRAGDNNRLGFEVLRHMLLTDIAGQIAGRDLKDQEQSKFSTILDIFAKHLYAGNADIVEQEVRSYHDPRTNDVVAIEGDGKVPDGPVIVKETPVEFRHVPGIGRVAQFEDKKKLSGSVLKSLYAIHKTGGILDPLTTVQDRIRLTCVVDENVDQLIARMVTVLTHQLGLVSFIYRDDSVGKDHGQSQDIDQRRIQVEMKGLNSHLEIRTVTLAQHFKERYGAGFTTYKEPEPGQEDLAQPLQLTGEGHDPFMNRRFIDLAPILFPYEIYKRDLNDEQRRKVDEMRMSLLHENTVSGFEFLRHQVV